MADLIDGILEFNEKLKAYARYLKKKMSQSEFQKWADYALELRQQALDGSLDLEEYQRIIRK